MDVTADRVVDLLADRGVPVFRCDTAEFPLALEMAGRFDGERWSGVLRTEHREVNLHEIRSVWYRRPTAFRFPAEMSAPERRHAAEEARQGTGGVLSALAVRWVNHPGREADASYKPAQLTVAAHCGLRVPRTIVTNSADYVRAFGRELDGPMVCKTLGASILTESGAAASLYTHLLTEDDLTDIDAVALTAHQFQEWVPKSHEARVVAVGERCFPVAIHARSHEARVDWRSDYDSLDYQAARLPDGVRAGVLAYLRRFGLEFGAFDFAITPDGQWWFLECNPGGQFGWLEDATGLPISETLADILQEGMTA